MVPLHKLPMAVVKKSTMPWLPFTFLFLLKNILFLIMCLTIHNKIRLPIWKIGISTHDLNLNFDNHMAPTVLIVFL